MVPKFMKFLTGSNIIDLGVFYYLYMSTMVAFCTNSINILAGANGVEGGQSLVIAVSLAANNFVLLGNVHRHDANLFSLYLLIPYIGVTSAYLTRNWYLGFTKVSGEMLWRRYFCILLWDDFRWYSALMLVVGILNNMTKTVLLFMLPQLFNFMYSCPQLFYFVQCPVITSNFSVIGCQSYQD